MLRAGIAGLSFSILLFELALTRLASVLLFSAVTPLVIAASMAAIGLGASWSRWRLDRDLGGARRLLSFGGAGLGPMILVATAALVRSELGFYLGFFLLPFLFFGAFASAAYAVLPRPALSYALDLLGGALGAAAAPMLMARVSDVDTAVVAGAAASLAAVLVLRSIPGARKPWLLVVPVLASVGQLVAGGRLLHVDPFSDYGFRPHLLLQTGDRGGHVLATAYGLAARTDLVATDEDWVRYMFTDRMYTARIVRWDGSSRHFVDPEAERLARLKGFAFAVLAPERVLVLGAGGGFDVALALQSGAKHVDAVEINAAMVRFTRSLSDFSGHLYDRREVTVHTEEARRFARETEGVWDIISLSLLETNPSLARTTTGYQSFVLTVEALGEYLLRLREGGAVAILQNTEPLAQKTVATGLAALSSRGLGTSEALARIAVLSLPVGEENPFARLVLLSREALSEETCRRLEAAAEAEGLKVQLLPGRRPSGSPYLDLATGRISAAQWANGNAFRVESATDDRPFFYDLNRAQPSLFVLAAGLSGLLLALVFALEPRMVGAVGAKGLGAVAFTGMGFMTLETVLLSRCQFLLGRPALGVPLVVGGMLTSTAAAALVSTLSVEALYPRRLLALGGILTAAAAVLEGRLWPEAVAWSRGSTTAGLAGIVALFVAAIGLPAGLCFPSCLELFGGGKGGRVAAMYASSAVASVLGASVACVVATDAGFLGVSYLGAACYVLAAALALPPPTRRKMAEPA